MAAKLMQALQYSSYGGGVSGLKVRMIDDPFLISFNWFIIFFFFL